MVDSTALGCFRSNGVILGVGGLETVAAVDEVDKVKTVPGKSPVFLHVEPG